MIKIWLGRFFRHCINVAAVHEAAQKAPLPELDRQMLDFMTAAEISDYLHGHNVSWRTVELRMATGIRVAKPLSVTAAVAGAAMPLFEKATP